MGLVLKMLAAGDDSENVDRPLSTFEQLWEIYPRKVAKKDAESAWKRIKPAEHARIIEAVQRAKLTDQWRKDRGAYVPYCATYLRGERWLDELETDLTMGMCQWNCNGTREPGKPQCALPAQREKNGVAYCAQHITRVN